MTAGMLYSPYNTVYAVDAIYATYGDSAGFAIYHVLAEFNAPAGDATYAVLTV